LPRINKHPVGAARDLRLGALHLGLGVCFSILFDAAGLRSAAWGAFPPLVDLSHTPADLELVGTSAGDHSGWALATGDIDGNGLVDLVVASHYAQPLGGTRKGELEIIWGAELSGTGLLDMADPSVALSRVFGKSSDYPLYPSLTCGDFNHDGCDDIVYALPYSYSIYAHGMAYVIFGSPTFPDTLDLQTNPANVMRILGSENGGSVGWAVCAGDLNSDDYDDIILSAPRLEYGEVYLIWGGQSFLPVYDLGQAPVGVTRIIDPIPHNYTGKSLACKDIDKDLNDDLLIGSEGPFGEYQPGMASLLYGQQEFPDTVVLSDPRYRIKNIFGEPYWDGRLGNQVAMGDINGDAREDLILAAPYADPMGCWDCGEVYVLYDANGLPDSSFVGTAVLPITRLLGSRDWYDYGVRLAAADLTGDGFDEVVVVSLGEDSSPSPIATTVVAYGQWALRDSIFLDSDATVTRISAATFDDWLGIGIAVADFNDDGVNDLALGASWADALGRHASGKTYILHGSASATAIETRATAAGFTVLQNRPNPFSLTTVIPFHLSRPGLVELCVFDVAGRRVAHFQPRESNAGPGSFTWDASDEQGRPIPSGIYFYRLEVDGKSMVRKMVILR
jgi:hypothetical protein